MCTGTTCTCVTTCASGAGTHGAVLNPYTEAFLNVHTGERGRGERGGGSPSVLLTKKSPRRVLTWPHKFTERNPWFLPIRSLRTGREQHVPESSNHPLYLIRLFSFRNLEETPTQRHKHQHNRHKHQHNTHTNTYSPTHRPTDPPNTTPLPSLSSPSPSHTHTQTQMYMCICICRCVCVSVCVRISVNVSVSVHVSVRVYVYDLPQWFHVFCYISSILFLKKMSS